MLCSIILLKTRKTPPSDVIYILFSFVHFLDVETEDFTFFGVAFVALDEGFEAYF